MHDYESKERSVYLIEERFLNKWYTVKAHLTLEEANSDPLLDETDEEHMKNHRVRTVPLG